MWAKNRIEQSEWASTVWVSKKSSGAEQSKTQKSSKEWRVLISNSFLSTCATDTFVWWKHHDVHAYRFTLDTTYLVPSTHPTHHSRPVQLVNSPHHPVLWHQVQISGSVMTHHFRQQTSRTRQNSAKLRIVNIYIKLNIRPVFSVTVPFLWCLSRKSFDIKQDAVLSCFSRLALSRFCPDFRILKKYLIVNVTHQ